MMMGLAEGAEGAVCVMLYNCIISREDNGHNRRTTAPVYYSHICTDHPPALWSIVTNTNSQLATQMVKLYCPEFVLIIRF